MNDATRLAEDNAELRIRVHELEETLRAIHSGDVDALIVNGAIYTLESALAANYKLREQVLAQMKDAVFAFDTEGLVIYVNAAAERRYGIASTEVLGRPVSDIFAETVDTERHAMDPVSPLCPAVARFAAMAMHRLPRGELIDVESIVSPLAGPDGSAIGSLAVIRDVTQRRRLEARRDALSRLAERLRDADEPSQVAFEAARVVGEVLGATRAGYGTFDATSELLTVERDWAGSGVESLPGTLRLHDFGAFVDLLRRGEAVVISDLRSESARLDLGTLEARGVRAFLCAPVVELGRLAAILFVHCTAPRPWTAGELEFVRDIAERARTVSERVRGAKALLQSELRLREANENLEAAVAQRTRELMIAEEALRQSQKMEAIGQLTGGIAHDFNNLLGSVSVSLQVLQARLRKGNLEQPERYIGMAQDSVKRAAALTQRLLAFARRQTLDPKPTDVNRLTRDLEELIRRTVGPDVQVEVHSAQAIWITKIDASQLENALLNLCINARDAMLPHGGRLLVQTSNHATDAREAIELGIAAGEYVCLAVTDTGTGMASDVVEHIFDPFFTTKPTGQGTGLGLSMVYGFVRQSGGHVRVSSEVGRGTTMFLYLPRYLGAATHQAATVSIDTVPEGLGETVLVIEDELTIRTLIEEVLEDAGYHVVSAGDGPSGLRVLATMQRIDLLISDVGLPGGLNGRQVADAARQAHPGLKVLFITGYALNAAVGNGLLESGMEVLTKPFEIAALTRKVRDMTAGGG